VQLSRIAYEMARNQTFPTLVEAFRKEFPQVWLLQYTPTTSKRPSSGSAQALIRLTVCLDRRLLPPHVRRRAKNPSPTPGSSVLVIRNDRTTPITVNQVGVPTEPKPITIPPRALAKLRGDMTYRLPDGSCVTVRDEPTISITQ
jgi:hypothetical protein